MELGKTKKVPEVMKNIECMPTTEQGMLLGRSATFVASSDIYLKKSCYQRKCGKCGKKGHDTWECRSASKGQASNSYYQSAGKK